MVVTPRYGEIPAVLAEMPLVLVASWFASRWTVRRLAVGHTPAERLVMGGTAFSLLIGAEIALAAVMSGRSAGEWLAGLGTVPGAIGLGGQLGFGFLPFIQGAKQR